VKASGRFKRISHQYILSQLVDAGRKLPKLTILNIALAIQWSGRFALDGVFGKLGGQSFVILICSDLVSLDVVLAEIYEDENYVSWKNFCVKLKGILKDQYDLQFFVSDGKKGLHQALKEEFQAIPRQLCKAHKLRRIFQIIPRIHGDAIDRLFSRVATNAILAKDQKEFRVYANLLKEFQKSAFHSRLSEPHQNKLKKIIGVLRYQQAQLHTRYNHPDLIGNDQTTNSHEGSINGFLKERMKLLRGFKKPEHLAPLVKLLIYYYRFHTFTSSNYPERNSMRPIELNNMARPDILRNVVVGGKTWSWLKNLLSGS